MDSASDDELEARAIPVVESALELPPGLQRLVGIRTELADVPSALNYALEFFARMIAKEVQEAILGAQTPITNVEERLDVLRRHSYCDPEFMAQVREALEEDRLLPPQNMPATVRAVREVGRGGDGVVFLGEYNIGDAWREVAIKFPRRLDSSSTALNEGQVQASITHPRVARVMYIGHIPVPYYVMDFVHGPKLLDYLQAHSLTIRERIEWVRAISEVLQEVHENGQVHGDLSWGNILVDAIGPRLVDFGTSQAVGTPVVPRGTPYFCAPEKQQGAMATGAMDVYSLGKLAMALVVPETALPMFSENRVDEQTILLAALKTDHDLAMIALKASRYAPSERYEHMRELADDLQRCLRGEPVEARSPHTLTYLGRRLIARHRNLMVAITATVIVLGAVTGWQVAARERTGLATTIERTVDDVTTAVSRAAPIPVRSVLEQLEEACGIGHSTRKQAMLYESLGHAFAAIGLYTGADRCWDIAAKHFKAQHGGGSEQVRRVMCHRSVWGQILGHDSWVMITEAEAARLATSRDLQTRRHACVHMALQAIGRGDADTAIAWVRKVPWDRPGAAAMVGKVLVERRMQDSCRGLVADAIRESPGDLRVMQIEPLCDWCDGLYEKALAGNELVEKAALARLGPRHPITIEARRLGLRIRLELGEDENHVTAAQELYDAGRAEWGEEHPVVIECGIDLVAVHFDAASKAVLQGDPEKQKESNRRALAVARTCADAARKWYGPQQPGMGRAVGALGLARWWNEEVAEGAREVRSGYFIVAKALGDKHPDTLRAGDEYASILLWDARELSRSGDEEMVKTAFAKVQEADDVLNNNPNSDARGPALVVRALALNAAQRRGEARMAIDEAVAWVEDRLKESKSPTRKRALEEMRDRFLLRRAEIK